MLSDKKFVRWANEHLVVLIAHNELLHEAEEVKGEDGKVTEQCPLYPGMTCRDHINAAVDIDSGRGEGLIQVPFVELCPNSWLVSPQGKVERIEEKDQFRPQAIREQAEALQAKLGDALPPKDWPRLRPLLEKAFLHEDEEAWREALVAWREVEKAFPKPGPGLAALFAARWESLDESVLFDAEYFLDLDDVDDDDRAQAKELLARIDVAVYGKHLPVRDRLKAWVEKQEAGEE